MSADYDQLDTRELAKSAAQFAQYRARVETELPTLFRQRIEREFESFGEELLDGFSDIVRDVLHQLHQRPLSDSLPGTPQPSSPAPRPRTPPVVADEFHATPDMSFFPIADALLFGLGDFDFGFPDNVEYSMGDRKSDSGYSSTSTGSGTCGESRQ